MGWFADALARSIGKSLGMGPSLFRRTVETRDVPVSMRDGVHLLTDVHQPVGGEHLPVLLMRTPYGRRGAGGLIERATALRGFQVVSQSCRGTFGSEGTFRPFRDDAQDGADTLDWLESQSWFHGQLVLGGLSYYGWAAWALAGAVAPSRIRAMVVQHAATTVRPIFRPGGVLALSTLANWVYLQSIREGGAARAWWGSFMRRRRVARALAGSSPPHVDTALTGGPVPFYQEVLNATEASAALWSDSDHSAALTLNAPPTHIMTAWFDFFLDAALADFATLTARGAGPRLTISVGVHFPDATSMKIEHPEMFAWYRAATDPAAPPPRASAVRLQLLGSKAWHDLAAWPPPATPHAFFLTADGELAKTPPQDAQPARFSYTTTDPTPSVGGQVMYDAGQLDNRALEQRPDVLTFTSAVLDDPLTVVGVAQLSIPVSTTAAATHLFVRLTDVTPDGRSLALTDGITSTTDGSAGSAAQLKIDFSATGFAIVPGHRLRLQVSSGAYPRYEAPVTAGTTTLELGPDSPAQLTLPVVAFEASAD